METSDLLQYVELQYPSFTDQTGEVETTWDSYGFVWASIQHVSAREYQWASAIRADATHVITIRHNPYIDETWRIVFDGKAYNIAAPQNNPNKKGEWTILVTIETDDLVEANSGE